MIASDQSQEAFNQKALLLLQTREDNIKMVLGRFLSARSTFRFNRNMVTAAGRGDSASVPQVCMYVQQQHIMYIGGSCYY